MLIESGIQCAYGRAIIHGRTFGPAKFVNNTRAQGFGDLVFELKKEFNIEFLTTVSLGTKCRN